MAACTGEGLQIIEGLRFGLIETFPKRLVLDEESSFPEKINIPILIVELSDRFLKSGDATPWNAKHIEESIPKGFCFGILTGLASPLPRELNCPLFDLIPSQLHERLPRCILRFESTIITTPPQVMGWS